MPVCLACEKFHKVLDSPPETDPERTTPPRKTDPPSPADSAAGAGSYLGTGLAFAASILVFLYLGQWVDRKLGTAPLFLVIGVFIGAGAGFYSLYKKLMAAEARDEDSRR
jgi:F0F1-type ATP synthase assembly protein I